VSDLQIATAKEVFDLLRDDLAAIEQEFVSQSHSQVEVITEIGRYLIAGGGKRIRPLLLLLSAKALGFEGESRIRLGSVVEMLHTATLVHDDIIDEADTRRGRPSSNTTWGNSKCVLAGDWLYMQAFNVALQEQNFHILDLLISLTQQMVEGELLQMQKLGHLINEEEYFDLIFRKTACLFKVSMQLGATVAGAPDAIEAQLGEYGRNLGLAFQVQDDYLDAFGDPSKFGKQVGGDIVAGKKTFLLIKTLEVATEAQRREIGDLQRVDDAAKVEGMLRIFKACGVDTWARELKEQYMQTAYQHLEDIAVLARRKDPLRQLAAFLVERAY